MKDDRTTDMTDKLEDAIDAIKSAEPAEADIARAAARVKDALASHRGPQAIVAEDGKLTPAGERWNSIEDYIAAIPTYLAGELSPAQNTLFEEEARSSIPLRRALNEARGRVVSEQIAERKTSRTGWYALAATVAALAIGVFIALPQLPSFDQSQLAQVDTVDGQLYQIVNGRLEALAPGTWIDGRQRIRSAPGSKAFITLDDGSEIEVDGRSELSLVRRGAGNRIDVSRGRILVHAAPQASGTLDVFTNEMEVSVVGTIFEVAHGAKGSRVAVVEGSVDVLLAGARTSLEPGQVMASRDMQYLAQNVADAVSWSDNADQYIAMLQEVQALQQELQAVMVTPPRYSTRLLDLAPETTAIYMAVPNAPEKIADVYNVVKARAQSSQFLAAQWAEFEAKSEAQYIDELMMWVGEIGSTLGEETVVILDTASFANLDGAVPIVLSEVNSASFAASFELMAQRLEEVIVAAGGEADDFELALINDPSEALDNHLSIMLIDDIMVATIDAATMSKMAGIIENGGSAFMDSDLHAL
ncbi:MAG: FecR family protein, partial [Gammaproteobacteria bacterium]